MTIYIDSDYRCYVDNDGTRRAINTDHFEGKCKSYIEGFRYIPHGETWVRSDGVPFVGESFFTTVDYGMLLKIQEQYEEDKAQMSDMQNALEILGVSP